MKDRELQVLKERVCSTRENRTQSGEGEDEKMRKGEHTHTWNGSCSSLCILNCSEVCDTKREKSLSLLA